jgi:hypothetical protein
MTLAPRSIEGTDPGDFSQDARLFSNRVRRPEETIAAGMLPPDANTGKTQPNDAKQDAVQQRMSLARSFDQPTVTTPVSARQTRVNASIVMFDEERALLSVSTADGTVEISVPTALIPPELRLFGQPVFLSLSREDGFTKPLIERRPVHVDPTGAEAEALAWLES